MPRDPELPIKRRRLHGWVWAAVVLLAVGSWVVWVRGHRVLPVAGGKLEVARPEWFAAGTADADGRLIYPPEALAGAYRATAPWGTILLANASYSSPFADPSQPSHCSGAMAAYTTPRRFLGVGRPHVDDEVHPHALVGGSVVLGEICGNAAIQAAHLGVDAGETATQGLYHGVQSNGIFLVGSPGLNQKRGTRLEDISVLTNDQDGQHSVLLEGDEGAVVDGLWIWTPGGTHGLILKGAHSTVRDFHCKGGKADCLLLKSDYRTAGSGYAADDRFEDIDISYLEHPGDTGGISFDAHWDNIDGATFRRVQERGLSYGFEGSGSWFYTLRGIDVEGWGAVGMAGPCAMFDRSSGIKIANFSCDENADAGDAAFTLGGRDTALRDGTVGCRESAESCTTARTNGIVDGGKDTVLAGLRGENLGGYLVATMESARHGSYGALSVSGMDGRMQTRLKPRSRSPGGWLQASWKELKANLRIVWQTTLTLLRRLSRWVRRRP